MSFGMIGALGGLGQGLVNEGAAIAKEEDRTKELAAKKDYQQWLLQTQEQFQVKADERAWKNEQERAPVKRDMAVDDDKAKARGKSAVAAETLETDVKVKKGLTEAGQTDADKKVKEATAKLYGERGDALDTKLDPADDRELKGLQARAGKLEDAITKAKADGSWTNTPEQKQLASQLAALQLKERTILQKYQNKEGGGAMPDPLKIRAPAAGGEPGKKPGGLIHAGDADRQDIFTGEWNKAQAALASAKTPEERSRAQTDLDSLRREMSRIGMQPPGATPLAQGVTQPPTPGAPKPAPKPAVAAPAVTDPTEVLGQELDATRAAYKALTEPSKRPGLAAGAPAREDYARKVSTLLDKVRQQERRYADAVGGQSASFATARP